MIKKLKERYRIWKDWRKYNSCGFIYQLKVFLRFRYSPEFEYWLTSDRLYKKYKTK